MRRRAALGPFDCLFLRVDLDQPITGHQLTGVGERPLGDSGSSAGKFDPRALRARLQTSQVAQHAGLRHFLVVLRHRGNEPVVGHDTGLGVLIGSDDHHESHRSLLAGYVGAKRTAAIGGSRASDIVHESPPSSEIHKPPLVEPKASLSPVSSIVSAWRHTKSYAWCCGSPFRSTSKLRPPSRVRATTTLPSTGMRRSSLTAGTNHAVSGSRGWAATAKPNFDGRIAVSSCQVAPASSERKTPLWCWHQTISGWARQWARRWTSWAIGSSRSSGGMYSAYIPWLILRHELPVSVLAHTPRSTRRRGCRRGCSGRPIRRRCRAARRPPPPTTGGARAYATAPRSATRIGRRRP